MPEILTLADEKRIAPVWWLHCERCKPPRSVQLDPDEIIALFGADMPIAQFRRRVSCRACGARGLPSVKVHTLADGRPR